MLLRFTTYLSAIFLMLVGARRRRLRCGPVSLVYFRMGPRQGEPWLFLHGLGSVAVGWAPAMRALRRECRIVVPELSALGGTRAPRGGVGVAESVEVLARLIERELGPRPVTVMGLSLGGWMAVRLALARPDLVGRLVLINAGGYRDQDWDTIKGLVTVHDLAGVDRLYGVLFARTPLLLRLGRRTFLDSYTSPGVRSILDGTSEDDVFDDRDLARLTMPTALIWGEHDGLFPVATARSMAAALPDSTLTVLPGCGHAVHLECPRSMLAAIQELRRATGAQTRA